MANPQRENGHVRIANDLFDAMIRLPLSDSERRILLFVIRKTYGWSKKADYISLSQFMLGTNLSHRVICRSLNKLVTKKTLVKVCGKNGQTSKYMLQKDYEKWVVTARTLVTKKTLVTNGVSGSDNLGIEVVVKKTHTINTPTIDTLTIDSCRRAASNPAIKRLIDYHFNNFAEHGHGKYRVKGPKEGKLLGDLLKTYPEAHLKELDDLMFGTTDPFIAESDYSIGVLSACINKLEKLWNERHKPIKRTRAEQRGWEEAQRVNALSASHGKTQNDGANEGRVDGDTATRDKGKHTDGTVENPIAVTSDGSTPGEFRPNRLCVQPMHGLSEKLETGNRCRGGGFQRIGTSAILRGLAGDASKATKNQSDK